MKSKIELLIDYVESEMRLIESRVHTYAHSSEEWFEDKGRFEALQEILDRLTDIEPPRYELRSGVIKLDGVEVAKIGFEEADRYLTEALARCEVMSTVQSKVRYETLKEMQEVLFPNHLGVDHVFVDVDLSKVEIAEKPAFLDALKEIE